MANEKILIGTEIKLNLHIEPMGEITMDDYDWVAEVYSQSPKKTITVNKDNAIRIDESNYLLLINTALIGSGDIKIKLTAHIPDSDFEDGFRTEMLGWSTEIGITSNI